MSDTGPQLPTKPGCWWVDVVYRHRVKRCIMEITDGDGRLYIWTGWFRYECLDLASLYEFCAKYELPRIEFVAQVPNAEVCAAVAHVMTAEREYNAAVEAHGPQFARDTHCDVRAAVAYSCLHAAIDRARP